MYTLRPERAEDWWAVEALYDLCFAPGREALSSYRLREGVAPVPGLSTIAEDDLGILSGAIRFWPVQIGSVQALLLGPIAVHPTRQGEGLGGALMHDTCDRAFDLGWERVLLVGDAPYYSRFGFKQLHGVDMPPPTNPERILGRGDWDGITGQVARAGS